MVTHVEDLLVAEKLKGKKKKKNYALFLPELRLLAPAVDEHGEEEAHHGGHQEAEDQPHPHVSSLLLSVQGWCTTTHTASPQHTHTHMQGHKTNNHDTNTTQTKYK